jgi:HEAT repeat protein
MPLIRKSATGGKTPGNKAPVDIRAGLASADVEERWAAARVAPEVEGGPEALITSLRTESDPRVREAMVTSLARINSAASIEALLALLRSDDASARTVALDTLRGMGSAMREHLPRLLADADSDVRVLSCEIVRSLPGPEATRILCDLLANETEVNVCAAALDVLAEVGEAQALSTLAQCATRFRDTPFLAFAVKIATDRILVQSPPRHE